MAVSSSTKDFENFTSLQGQWLTALKHYKALPAEFKLFSLMPSEYFFFFFNLKCQKTKKKKLYLLAPILVNLLSSSIYRLANKKWRVFFPSFFIFFMRRFVYCFFFCGWLILSILFMNSFDFLFLPVPDSLEYVLCQHWKSLFVSPITDIKS